MKGLDVANQKVLSVLKGHDSWVLCLAFSPCGKMLASGGNDGQVKLWDVATGKALMPSLSYDEERIWRVVFHPTEKRLLIKLGDKVLFWDYENGKIQRELKQSSVVTCLAVSQDGKLLVTGTTDNFVTITSLASNSVLSRVACPTSFPQDVVLSPKTNMLGIGCSDTDKDFKPVHPEILLFDLTFKTTKKQ